MKKVILMSALFSTTVVLSACGGGSGKDAAAAPSAAIETPAVTEPATEPVTEEETTEAAAEVIVMAMNEPATLQHWDFTVTDVQIVDKISESEYLAFTPNEGNKFLLVTASVTNNSEEADTFLPSYGTTNDVMAKLYCGDSEILLTNLLGYDNKLLSVQIEPQTTKTGDLTFEIPDSVADGEEEILLNFKAGKEEIVYKVR